MDILTIQDIRYIYYREYGEVRGFEEYLRDEYTPTYDENLTFIGWVKS